MFLEKRGHFFINQFYRQILFGMKESYFIKVLQIIRKVPKSLKVLMKI